MTDLQMAVNFIFLKNLAYQINHPGKWRVCYLLTSTSINSIQFILKYCQCCCFLLFFLGNYKDSSCLFYLLKADLYWQAHITLWTWFHPLKDSVLWSKSSVSDWRKGNFHCHRFSYLHTKLILFPVSMRGAVLCDLNSSSSQYTASDKIKIHSWTSAEFQRETPSLQSMWSVWFEIKTRTEPFT